jgi:2-methylisocitrate lyase-like PEP mutase family enzyme
VVTPKASVWFRRAEAIARVRAAVDARDEGADISILARTDALGTDGLDEALSRAQAFTDAGADMLFVEAPTTEKEMETICRRVPGHHLANMLEDGVTPFLSPTGPSRRRGSSSWLTRLPFGGRASLG